MSFISLLLIGVGLSMDAFAVSLCKGLSMKRLYLSRAALIALFFGGFQALMPLIGWLLGQQFERWIVSFDHWIAFALLAAIGGKMLYDALRGDKDGDGDCAADALRLKELLLLAVATSIDALAVGVTFAFLRAAILPSIAIIGVTTFLLSLAGVAIGFRFGAALKSKAQLAGGAVLILIGLKILLEHLGVL